VEFLEEKYETHYRTNMVYVIELPGDKVHIFVGFTQYGLVRSVRPDTVTIAFLNKKAQ